ncbi:MAG: PstS family phosphate ABC transporter substrate-binding protein [Flammeovirgaceae bacterium]
MKKFVLLFILNFSFLFAHSQAIKVKGSDTMLPMTQAMAELFMDKNQGNIISVTGGGSGVGITSLKNASCDLAMSSRSLKMSEKMTFKNEGKDYVEKIVAYDALSIIVHPSNKIEKLTKEQIEGIFTGRITNWKELGGDDMKIVVYTRESSSGTYEFMKSLVMDDKEFVKTAITSASNSGIVQSVSQTKGAIGYCGIAYLEEVIKPLQVSFDGKNYVKSTFKNALDKTYPILRPLYFYYLKANETKVKPFIDFTLTELGQKLITHKGYIPTFQVAN